ncbi:MAG: DUF2934 domain-containing protein [Thiobacillus sp.]|nr:DUF2934 domain-containing protein [Thiobacillus sp.]
MSATAKAGKQATGKKTEAKREPDDFDAMVAEAAYYLAEQRGFCPGCELDDWLAAEARVRAQAGVDLSAPRAGLRPARPPRGSSKLGAALRLLESGD